GDPVLPSGALGPGSPLSRGRTARDQIQFSNSRLSQRFAAPVVGQARGCLHYLPSNMRGAERRKALSSVLTPFGVASFAKDARLPALHRGVFLPTTGPAFSEAFRASAVSQLLAGGPSASGGSPAAARVQGYEPCPQAPHPAPSSKRP